MNEAQVEKFMKGWDDQYEGDAGDISPEGFDSGGFKVHPSQVPAVPHIDAAILAAVGEGLRVAQGSLDMGDWHSCGTSHCRAGWAVVLAGPRGWALEKEWGAELAGTLIYRASRPGVPAPDFFAHDAEALDDLRTWAKLDPLPTDGETA